jgi:hypothetical protein
MKKRKFTIIYQQYIKMIRVKDYLILVNFIRKFISLYDGIPSYTSQKEEFYQTQLLKVEVLSLFRNYIPKGNI